MLGPSFLRAFSTALAFCSLSDAAALGLLTSRQACSNGPTTRDCWSAGYNINNDPDTSFPPGGQIRSYVFNVGRTTLNIAGVSRSMLTINGQYPGPTINANWGDTIRVTVKNTLTDNGTDIHWHGIRQLNTAIFDGTPGTTECPLAPGQQRDYIFRATQYGTSWYHSHFPAQYSDGVVGPIVIAGPASANYDIDLGAIPLTDWYHRSFFQVAAAAKTASGPPTADTILINGKNVGSTGGSYDLKTLTPGKKHLVRFINTGTNNYFHVSLDGHPFQVVAADFNPIVPYTTTDLTLAIGQRYDVIINANQATSNYWLRVRPGGAGCDGPVAVTEAKSIFRYTGASAVNPTSTAYTISTGCTDASFTMYRSQTVPNGNLALNPVQSIGFQGPTATTPIFWTVNSSPLRVDWIDPLLAKVRDGDTNYDPRENVRIVGNTGWTYWVVQQDITAGPRLPHPIHLHGHEYVITLTQSRKRIGFYVIGQGTGSYSSATLTYVNPIRRDTATLPANGYLILAFKTDNPGAWLMHCHVAFHAEGGFGQSFLERAADYAASADFSQLTPVCNAWQTYSGGNQDPNEAGI
ncbi:Cupredoxin [Paraphoma chrysanthemicola]|nr:Cupredoxin [Paraphoma chrysanthemicola]